MTNFDSFFPQRNTPRARLHRDDKHFSVDREFLSDLLATDDPAGSGLSDDIRDSTSECLRYTQRCTQTWVSSRRSERKHNKAEAARARRQEEGRSRVVRERLLRKRTESDAKYKRLAKTMQFGKAATVMVATHRFQEPKTPAPASTRSVDDGDDLLFGIKKLDRTVTRQITSQFGLMVSSSRRHRGKLARSPSHIISRKAKAEAELLALEHRAELMTLARIERSRCQRDNDESSVLLQLAHSLESHTQTQCAQKLQGVLLSAHQRVETAAATRASAEARREARRFVASSPRQRAGSPSGAPVPRTQDLVESGPTLVDDLVPFEWRLCVDEESKSMAPGNSTTPCISSANSRLVNMAEGQHGAEEKDAHSSSTAPRHRPAPPDSVPAKATAHQAKPPPWNSPRGLVTRPASARTRARGQGGAAGTSRPATAGRLRSTHVKPAAPNRNRDHYEDLQTRSIAGTQVPLMTSAVAHAKASPRALRLAHTSAHVRTMRRTLAGGAAHGPA